MAQGVLCAVRKQERLQGMKPIVPTVSTAVWKELYNAAQKFNALQPWDVLDDADAVCLRNPMTGDIGFGVVMGSGGSIFGLCLYRGAEGLDIYRRTIEGEVGREGDDLFAMQNCVKLELGPRSDMMPEDFAVMKQLSLSFKGKNAWPEFRSMLSGYAPWFLTEPEARFLTLGINAACFHYDRVRRGEVEESIRSEECLMYSPVEGSQTEFRSEWGPLPVYEKKPLKPPVLNLGVISSIKAKKLKPDSEWEVDSFYLPMPVMDRDRPYFARTAVACQQSSGFVFDMSTAPPETTQHQLLADVICSSIEKSGFKPDAIFVRNEEFASALAPLANVLSISILGRKNLGSIKMLKESMMGYMMGEGKGGRGRK
ncbi:MAG TPA: hypothetical protein PL001_09035 [Candidatus Kryptobacter bacterium]|nr:hypothetical protein [Candidatus Kryptobacter bacterium]